MAEKSDKLDRVTTQAQEAVAQIEAALSRGLAEAARLYKGFVAAGISTEEMRQAAPWGAAVWSNLDDIACERVDPRVFLLPGCVALALRKLPIGEQRRCLTEGVEWWDHKAKSARRLPLRDFQTAQAVQVFGRDGVRSLAAQQAFVAERSLPGRQAMAKPAQAAYDLFDTHVVIRLEDGRSADLPKALVMQIASKWIV